MVRERLPSGESFDPFKETVGNKTKQYLSDLTKNTHFKAPTIVEPKEAEKRSREYSEEALFFDGAAKLIRIHEGNIKSLPTLRVFEYKVKPDVRTAAIGEDLELIEVSFENPLLKKNGEDFVYPSIFNTEKGSRLDLVDLLPPETYLIKENEIAQDADRPNSLFGYYSQENLISCDNFGIDGSRVAFLEEAAHAWQYYNWPKNQLANISELEHEIGGAVNDLIRAFVKESKSHPHMVLKDFAIPADIGKILEKYGLAIDWKIFNSQNRPVPGENELRIRYFPGGYADLEMEKPEILKSLVQKSIQLERTAKAYALKTLKYLKEQEFNLEPNMNLQMLRSIMDDSLLTYNLGLGDFQIGGSDLSYIK